MHLFTLFGFEHVICQRYITKIEQCWPVRNGVKLIKLRKINDTTSRVLNCDCLFVSNYIVLLLYTCLFKHYLKR